MCRSLQTQFSAFPALWIPSLLQQLLLLLPLQVLPCFYSADGLERQRNGFSHVLGTFLISARCQTWLGSNKYPTSLCLSARFREPHAVEHTHGMGTQRGRGCRKRLLPPESVPITIPTMVLYLPHPTCWGTSISSLCHTKTCPSLPCSPERFATIATFFPHRKSSDLCRAEVSISFLHG